MFYRLVNLFGLLHCSPLGLHAQMHQKQRLKNLVPISRSSFSAEKFSDKFLTLINM
jgi:hypothetical protein